MNLQTKPATPEDPLSLLSERELQVFKEIAKGRRPSLIAEKLQISTKTISTYRDRIKKKLKARSNAELAVFHARAELAMKADHTLLAQALVAGVAKWHSWPGTGGELWINSLRYAMRDCRDGLPLLNDVVRDALATALRSAREIAA